MENRRGSEIFLGVVGVTTLLVAIIGATFAYFSATAKSGNESVAVGSTKVDLGYSEVTTRLKTDMIPATYTIAKFAATNAAHIAEKGECKDDVGNEVCSIYEFYIGNPGSAEMPIEGSINVVTNGFTNLRFQIMDETGAIVFPAIKDKEVGIGEDNLPGAVFPADAGTMNLTSLSQTLKGSTSAPTEENKKNPSAYTPNITVTETTTSADLHGKTNVRHYTMLIWLNETGTQQDEDGKIFTAGISFSTGGTSGVTGIIAAANATPGEDDGE